MPENHIIVGDGVTAAEFATSRNYEPGDRVTIIGPDVENLGRGIAYAKAPEQAPWRYAYLLNSPARSVDPTFAEWLSNNWEYIAERMQGRSPNWLAAAQRYVEIDQIASLNAPREFCGDFFHDETMSRLQALRKKQVNVQTICARASLITHDNRELHVITEDGQRFAADSIDVATGGPANQRIQGDTSQNSFTELFGNEQEISEQLKASASIVAIGAGAAMLDLLRFCQSIQNENEIAMTVISPSGKTLEALIPGDTFTPAEYICSDTFKHAQDFIAEIKRLQIHALEKGHNFYETRVGLRSLFSSKSVNDFVPDITEARKVARPLFKHFEGGTRDSVYDFNRLCKTGNIKIIRGKVKEIRQTTKSTSIIYSDANGTCNTVLTNVVVNCAGPGTQNRFDALTQHMLNSDWISICPQSGGILVGDSGKTTAPGVRYLGPAVTSIGDVAQQVPLYDAFRLRRAVELFNQGHTRKS